MTATISATTATPPLVVHEVTGTTSVEACTHESYEVRPVNLASAAYLLRMSVADFDCVRVAAALEDIKCCPVCPHDAAAARLARAERSSMSYVLIGESCVGDGPLFVLWTRDASGVHVLPVGSRDRRDIQAVGRRLMEAWDAGRGPTTALEMAAAAVRGHAEGRSLRLVDLDDTARDEIARSIANDIDAA